MAAHGASSLGLPLLNPLFALLVIRLASLELWGQFVPALAMAQLAAHLVGWGNKEHLLRQFSLNPHGIGRAWRSSLLTRLALLAPLPAALAMLAAPGLAGLLVLLGLALALDQSFDVLVLYRRDFAFSIAVEAFGLLALAVPVWLLSGRLTLAALLLIYALSNLGKAGIFAARYRRQLAGAWPMRLEVGPLRQAFPFFLLGFSGLLQSRVDLYLVAALQPAGPAAAYQVFTNWMIYGQSISAILLAPFARGLYRLPERSVRRMSAAVAAAGLGLAALYLPAAHWLLASLYGLPITPLYTLLGGLFILPAFLYLPAIYALFRAGRPGEVVAVNFAGMALSAGLSLLLLPRHGLPGALAASAAAQWFMASIYLARRRFLRAGQALGEGHAVPELPRSA